MISPIDATSTIASTTENVNSDDTSKQFLNACSHVYYHCKIFNKVTKSLLNDDISQ